MTDEEFIHKISDLREIILSNLSNRDQDEALEILKDIQNRQENPTPQDVVELAKRNPRDFRSGLELLADKDEGTYDAAVPQLKDGNTNLWTKNYFENKRLERAIQYSQQTGAPFSIALLDVDYLKGINLKHTHLGGDKVILAFANLLRRNFRTENRRYAVQTVEEDQRKKEADRRKIYTQLDELAFLTDQYLTPARLGGDEFGVLLLGSDEKSAEKAMKRLFEQTRAIAVKYNGKDMTITISGGIAQYEPGMAREQLIANALNAREYSKSHGKDMYTLYSQIKK